MPIVLTLDKSISVLEAIVRQPEGIGTRAIAHELKINVATAHNIATTFAARGYIRQDEVTRLFHPGLRLMLLSRHPAYLRMLTASARDVVRAVAAELNESVMLASSDHGRLINLEYVPSQQALRVQEPEDVSGVAHCTAFGKLILAHFDEASLESYLAQHGLGRYTASTITDPAAFRAELLKVRSDGFSHTKDEYCEGISALAVPIHDPWGSVFAALGASAPTVRLQNAEQVEFTLNGLRRGAREIEQRWTKNGSPTSSDAPPDNRRGRPRKTSAAPRS